MRKFSPSILNFQKMAQASSVDRDVSTCSVDEVRTTNVLLTMVGGKIVWQA
jgi:hypothetical protein